VAATVQFEFNGYGRKTALLFQGGETESSLKFHHLPTNLKIGFPELWARGKVCGQRSSAGAFGREKSTLSPYAHQPTDTAHLHGKVFIVSLLTYTERWARRIEKERTSELRGGQQPATTTMTAAATVLANKANGERWRSLARWTRIVFLSRRYIYRTAAMTVRCTDIIYCYIRLTYVDAERQLADKTSGEYGQDDGKITSPSAPHGCAVAIRILYPLFPSPFVVLLSQSVYTAKPKTQRSYNNIHYFIQTHTRTHTHIYI